MTTWSEVLKQPASAGPPAEAKSSPPEGATPNVGKALVDLLTVGDDPSALQSFIMGTGKTLTFGQGDEIKSFIKSKFKGKDYDEQLQNERNLMDRAQAAHPAVSAAGEVTGSILPALLTGGGSAPTTLLGAAGKGALWGGASSAAQGFGEGEGLEDRARKAIDYGTTGALFGAALGPLAMGATKLVKGAKPSVGRPTVEGLRDVKNAAYDAVAKDEQLVPTSSLRNMYADVSQKLRSNTFYDPSTEADKPIESLLTKLKTRIESTAGKSTVNKSVLTEGGAGVPGALDESALSNMSIGQLDKLRQDAWEKYMQTARGTFQQKGGDARILDVVNSIDDVIESTPGGEKVVAARAAHMRYKKAQMLDFVTEQAELGTASTGSGGNINNKYRQAIKNILTDPNKRRMFNPDEQQVMKQLTNGHTLDNVLRLVGKVAPGGHGLMLALTLGGGMYGSWPLAAAGAVAGEGAKIAADLTTTGRVQSLIDMTRGYTPPPVTSALPAKLGMAGREVASTFPLPLSSMVAGEAQQPEQPYVPSLLEQTMRQQLMGQ